MLTCPQCQQSVNVELKSPNLAEYVTCAHCQHRWLQEPTAQAPAQTSAPAPPQAPAQPPAQDPSAPLAPPLSSMEMDWGEDDYAATGAAGGAADSPEWGDDSRGRDGYAELYPTTSKPLFVGLLLVLAGLSILVNAAFLDGIANDDEKLAGTVGEYNKRGLDTSEEKLKNYLEVVVMGEVIAAIVVFTGAVLAFLKQGYRVALMGCVAALLGIGVIFTATLFGAAAIWLLIGSRHEFGIIDEEGW